MASGQFYHSDASRQHSLMGVVVFIVKPPSLQEKFSDTSQAERFTVKI